MTLVKKSLHSMHSFIEHLLGPEYMIVKTVAPEPRSLHSLQDDWKIKYCCLIQ